MSRLIQGVLITPGLLIAIACGGGGGNPPPPSPTSTISAVTISPPSMALNASQQQQFTATVTGTGSYSTAVTWSANGGTLGSTSGSMTTWTAPATTGSYWVMATSNQDSSKSATAIATVTVGTTVSITSFTATPTTITAGQNVTLTPVFTNATSASINPGVVGNVTSGTGYTVTPAATTTYTLSANGNGGPVTQAVTVTVSNGSTQFSQQGPKLVGTGGSFSNQGASVCLSADGNTAIVGGPGDITQAGTAAAWVWTRIGGVWTQQGGKLVALNLDEFLQQGWSVSLSANGNTAIVGGPTYNNGTGAAWVWTRSGGVWTQQGTKLVASSGANLGYSVALSADGNTAIVGGPSYDSGTGAAWVWTRSGGVWTQQGAELVGSGAEGAGYQGESVSLSADGNTAIVGGYGDSSFTGAAWVWTRSGGVWAQQGTKLVGSGGGGELGSSVFLSADGNTAIAGGPWDNSGAGAAWVWTRSGGAWTQQGTKLVGSGAVVQWPIAEIKQGYSVSLSADGNTAIVGGYCDSAATGAAWIWTRSGGFWTQKGAKLVGSGVVGDSQQGFSVSLSADGNTAILGGRGDNSNAGAAWVFTR